MQCIKATILINISRILWFVSFALDRSLFFWSFLVLFTHRLSEVLDTLILLFVVCLFVVAFLAAMYNIFVVVSQMTDYFPCSRSLSPSLTMDA